MLVKFNKLLYPYLPAYGGVCVCADVSVGPEGACIILGILRVEEGLQTEESGDYLGAKERGMPQTGKPT